MLTKRPASLIAAALAIAGALTLAGCTGTQPPVSSPSVSTSETPTPTPTAFEPPADEAEAIAAATATLTKWFEVRGEVNAAGGTDTAPLEELSIGRALSVAVDSATRIATGPLVNEDNISVDGPSTTEGQITFEMIAAYGQERDSIPNGLVTINACQDSTGYKITTNDGKPALTDPNNARLVYDYQVVYDASKKTWLVFDLINVGTKC